MTIYDKNILFLEENYPYISEVIDDINIDDSIIVDKSLDDEYIVGIKENNRIRYLNSRYNCKKSVEIWSEEYKDCNQYSVFIVYGLSNFEYIKSLRKMTGKYNPMLLIEPNPCIFRKIIEYVDLSEIIDVSRMWIVLGGLNDNIIYDFLGGAIDYGKMFHVQRCCMPGYYDVYSEKWNELVKILKQTFELLIMDRNTQIQFGEEFIGNMLANYRDFTDNYSINKLVKRFSEGNDLTDVPAIIVSAGPSLSKNVKELKRAKNKAFIIAVDAALKVLYENGIKPDIAVTVDPHKPLHLFLYPGFSDVPLLVCQQSNKSIWNIHNNKRFYFGEDNSYMDDVYRKLKNENLLLLETGGSVANNAFSFAQMLGIKNIILVGQDLGFTDNKFHALANGDSEADIFEKKGKIYVKVDSIDGGKIWTDKAMEMYIKWFEKQIVRYPELNVIDATEGGALISGTSIVSLVQAIDSYCKKEINIEAIITDIDKEFSDNERDKILNDLDDIPNTLSDIRYKINRGIRDYERIRTLFHKRKTSSREYFTLIKEIEEINNFIENEPVMELVSMYNRETEFKIQSKAYNMVADEDAEMKLIVESGIEMLESYKEAMEKLIEELTKVKEIDMHEMYFNLRNSKIRLMKMVKYARQQNYYQCNNNIKGFTTCVGKVIEFCQKYDYLTVDRKDINRISSFLMELYEYQKKQNYIEMADKIELEVLPYFYELLNMVAMDENRYWESYLERNLLEIEKKDKELATKIRNHRIDENMYKASIAYSGDIALEINKNNTSIKLNSKVDPYYEQEQLWDIEYEKEIEDYVIVGFNATQLQTTGYYNKDARITIIESDLSVIKLFLMYYELWIQLGRKINIIYDPDFSRFSSIMKNFTGKLIVNNSAVKNIEDVNLKKVFENIVISISSIQNNRKLLEKNFVDNIICAHKLISKASWIIKDKTVILVAGGPSLDDEIDKLKVEYESKKNNKDTIIMAVGTVAKKLVDARIIPDVLILSDPKDSIINQIKDIDVDIHKQIKLFYVSTVSNICVEFWKGEKYMILQKDFEKAEKYAKALGETLCLTGGSVSTVAIDIALRYGCKKLITMGLDLAYTNGKIHAVNCNTVGNESVEQINNLELIKAARGGNIKTGKVYQIYRKFIEKRIKMADVKINIYNTSKGAYIEGMKHCSFEEAIVNE